MFIFHWYLYWFDINWYWCFDIDIDFSDIYILGIFAYFWLIKNMISERDGRFASKIRCLAECGRSNPPSHGRLINSNRISSTQKRNKDNKAKRKGKKAVTSNYRLTWKENTGQSKTAMSVALNDFSLSFHNKRLSSMLHMLGIPSTLSQIDTEKRISATHNQLTRHSVCLLAKSNTTHNNNCIKMGQVGLFSAHLLNTVRHLTDFEWDQPTSRVIPVARVNCLSHPLAYYESK